MDSTKKTQNILCVDIGTTSLKVGLLSDKRKVDFFSRQSFDNFDEKNISEKWSIALKNAVKELKSQNSDFFIDAICISGNGPTVVSEDGTTLLWNEDISFCNFSYQTKSLYIPRFFAFKKKFESIWNESKFIFSGFEYLIYKLTNNPISVLPSERFSIAYWNDEELLNCGFSCDDIKKLPKFVKSGSLAGKITKESSKFLGIAENTKVFCGAPDFVVALLGTGTSKAGTLCDRAGSSEGINFCTKKPIFAEGIRTLPSIVDGLWNASILINDSGKRKDNDSKNLLNEFSSAIEKLRKLAIENEEEFPEEITITGGQSLDENWLQQKSNAANIKISIPFCNDAELIGDLIFAQIGLGNFNNFDDSRENLCENVKTFSPKKN